MTKIDESRLIEALKGICKDTDAPAIQKMEIAEVKMPYGDTVAFPFIFTANESMFIPMAGWIDTVGDNSMLYHTIGSFLLYTFTLGNITNPRRIDLETAANVVRIIFKAKLKCEKVDFSISLGKGAWSKKYSLWVERENEEGVYVGYSEKLERVIGEAFCRLFTKKEENKR